MRPADRKLAGGLALLGFLTVFWGGNWPAMKLAVRGLDPWTFRTLCLVVGGGGLLGILRLGGQGLHVPAEERPPLVRAALFNITLWHLCSAYGLTAIRAGRGAIIAFTMPLWTALFGWLLLGERLTRSRCLALALGLLGLAILLGPEARQLALAPLGTLAMLAAAASWGFGTVLVKGRRWSIPTAVLTAWQLVLGAIPVVLGAIWRGGPSSWQLGPEVWLGAAYATLVGVILCHSAWFKVVELLPAAVAAIGTMGVPIVGVLSSALVLGEPVGLRELAALAVVILGLAVLAGGVAGAGSWGRRLVSPSSPGR